MIIENAPQHAEISIIIVNYNSGVLLKNCVHSLYQNLEVNFEVIIYDNASHDESLRSLESETPGHPGLKIIHGAENLGFAKANNLAARHASGKFFHFLNPDIIVNADLNRDYRLIFQEQEFSIFVTSLKDTDGNLQKNKHLIPRIGNMFRYFLGSSNVAFWNIGASVIIQKDSFYKMGGWPEDYFMYAEDLDFFYSASKHHIPVKYLDTQLVHIGKGTTHQIWSDEQRAMRIEHSYKKFFLKYHATWEYFLIRPIHMLYWLFTEPGKLPFYSKVIFKSFFKNR